MCPRKSQVARAENKGVRGRGEFRQVVRSWVMGPEGQREGAGFYSEK